MKQIRLVIALTLLMFIGVIPAMTTEEVP